VYRRLTIILAPEERELLDRLSQADLRPVKEQLRWLLRQEATRRGLCPCEAADPAQPEVAHGKQRP
jgi:hypothetical protein